MKLTSERIIDSAMETFAEVGYDGLSMRRVAERLDVHAGSLYYHVRNKDVLIRLMADRLTRRAYDAGTVALDELASSAGWRPRIEAQAMTLRAAMLEHPGGALLLARAPELLTEPALALMERLLQTLSDTGVPESECAVAADTMLSYVSGYVLQEQSAGDPPLEPEQIGALLARFPLVAAGAGAGPGEPEDADASFAGSVRFFCGAVEALRR
jgi:TetR/AcrR family transcriptional regulator, tetracycline repressor protein